MSQQRNYKSKIYQTSINEWITSYLKEAVSIRGISRLLQISTKTVMRRILEMGEKIDKPPLLFGKEYEMDEMCTYLGNKKRKIWIVYAICKKTKGVIDFRIGARTSKTLKGVIDTLKLTLPKKIHTDKLIHYVRLIGKELHSTKHRGTNYIERMNLTIRTHLKRLSRRTICFSKSLTMLTACLKIYFWN